jgi:hypothetical protein
MATDIYQNFGEVDGKVMQMLASSADTNFSFQGMKRSLKVHQERLSRSLSRLSSLGLVDKNDEGYSITKKGVKATGRNSLTPGMRLVVGSSYLPNDVDATNASGILKGRWFSGMRWLGSSPTGQGMDLKWVTDDGEIQVQAFFKDRLFEVSLGSFPPAEEARAREVALRLYAKIINALYQNRCHPIN